MTRGKGEGNRVLALGCLTVAAMPLVLLGVVGVIGALVAVGSPACELDLDLTPEKLGVSGQPDGPITAHVSTCRGRRYMFIQLLDADGTVLWSAEAPEPTRVREFDVGSAPEGFEDVLQLTEEPLDPEAAYDLHLSALEPATSASTTGAADGDMASTGSTIVNGSSIPMEVQLFGAAVRFRPKDLQPDGVWFEGRSLTPEEFERAACADTDR